MLVDLVALAKLTIILDALLTYYHHCHHITEIIWIVNSSTLRFWRLCPSGRWQKVIRKTMIQ